MKTTLNKIFTSKLPGVLAGLLIIILSLITIVSGFATGCSSCWIFTAIVFLPLFIIPASIGLVISLFNKPDKRSYIGIGITQILIGLFIAGIHFLFLRFISSSYGWQFINLIVVGGLIFLISGIYLVIYKD